ncbi:response regulator transcription factor [Mediannikoviicoccus vaginalis]|uniref:response regulator transcription factor n=1 Tax=Mediannikoviicoccus vaginalis TaxID=2899727 RepID=UPI001F25F1DC|nr:response regulator transcription factor [Mediannikoviicoccus vaginalis]
MANILILEDEKNIREVLVEYLKVSGATTFEAEDGNEAVEILKGEDIDVAVLDIMVPGMSGIDVLSFIRKNPKTKNIGVIMLTALDDIGTQVSAFNNFADEYLVKPVSPIILIKRIETLLRRIKPQVLVDHEFIMDDESYTVFVDGEEIPFTLSEFLILQMLYENKNKVLSREQLIMGAFNEDYIGNDRIIDAHIKNIRKKLGKDYIKTVIGIGYKFSENEIR